MQAEPGAADDRALAVLRRNLCVGGPASEAGRSAAIATGVTSRYRRARKGNPLGGATMTPTTLADSRVQSALRHEIRALKRVANYVLPAALDRRMQQLGENK